MVLHDTHALRRPENLLPASINGYSKDSKRTVTCEDAPSLSDDNDNNNVKLTEIARDTGCDFADMQSRQMN
jgi:hypothetical protein